MKYFSSPYSRKKNLRPPDLYEFYVDNFWFKTIGIDSMKIDEPLRGEHKADIVIIGGGFTGLSTAYNLRIKYPNKKIVLLEGAFCGFGASGRNGGFCVGTSLLNWGKTSPDRKIKDLEVSLHGIKQIKQVMKEFDVKCDFEENGMLEVATTESQIIELKEFQNELAQFDLKSTLLQGDELKKEINSPFFEAGLINETGANLNPAKLSREMKRVIEELDVEVRERTVITHITPGKVNIIETELGQIQAPTLVIALNAYAHKIGFFKDRVFPVGVFQIATEPLSNAQWDSIGWQNRQGLSDMRALFSYSIPTADGRIVMGGVDPQYYLNDGLTSGNDRMVTPQIINNLHDFFPQLKGIKIEHSWGGTTAYTIGRIPSIGVMGEHQNIYFGAGFNEGVPATQTAGKIIADLMADEKNHFTDHFVVNRNIPWAGPRFLRDIFGKSVKWMMKKFGYSPVH